MKDKKITVSHFRRQKEAGKKIVALTAYDAPTAALAEECGVELILIGDSLGMAVLGYSNTIPVTLEQILHHCAAARRGARRAFIVGDMPFMTYQISPEDALRNAGRLLQEAGADGVKLEGGERMAPTVERLVAAGVPVMGHIGLLPQNVLTSGGYRIAGRSEKEAEHLLLDAKAIQDAGAFCIVLEGMPAELSARITKSLAIPTIGIGGGPSCDGQIQVVNDLLGLFTDFIPKHTKRYANLSEDIRKALGNYAEEVRSGAFPSSEQSF
ncbi:MAG: 3-methyl-2-oxobutanoate hydroxymethyltransferase [Lentisphaerae bacterium GWF2_52_8]|nr:MAG: 3-methyl-2-oxobutanoate hydroxymethyltransferase [Lentisphaerae bacterium GWF2_52_8]